MIIRFDTGDEGGIRQSVTAFSFSAKKLLPAAVVTNNLNKQYFIGGKTQSLELSHSNVVGLGTITIYDGFLVTTRRMLSDTPCLCPSVLASQPRVMCGYLTLAVIPKGHWELDLTMVLTVKHTSISRSNKAFSFHHPLCD